MIMYIKFKKRLTDDCTSQELMVLSAQGSVVVLLSPHPLIFLGFCWSDYLWSCQNGPLPNWQCKIIECLRRKWWNLLISFSASCTQCSWLILFVFCQTDWPQCPLKQTLFRQRAGNVTKLTISGWLACTVLFIFKDVCLFSQLWAWSNFKNQQSNNIRQRRWNIKDPPPPTKKQPC